MKRCAAVLGLASVSVAGLAAAVPIRSASLPIAIFDGSSRLKWETVNDPVMGGQSVSTFSVDQGKGDWKGQVRIVPFLHAAGFCTLRGSGAIPVLADYKGLEVNVAALPTTNISKFQLQFSSSDHGVTGRQGSFQADFSLKASGAASTVFIPFSEFIETWRGERVGGAPTSKQLSTLESIGLGTDGIVGNFDLELVSIVATSGPSPGPTNPPAPSDEVELVTFDQDGKHTYGWIVVNDPVMGGRSRSTFKQESGRGIFNGTVAIVPQLKAPGFCNAEARPTITKPKIPDVGHMLSGGLLFKMISTGEMNVFKAAFGTSTEYDFGSYKADFTVPSTGQMQEVYIPFKNFSNKWSPSTGEPTIKCSSDRNVCPTARSLGDIGSIGIWAEGTAGDFHVEIVSISAVSGPTRHN